MNVSRVFRTTKYTPHNDNILSTIKSYTIYHLLTHARDMHVEKMHIKYT